MILLHRITPFVLLLVAGAGFGIAMAFPDRVLLPLGCSLALAFLLLGRLADWQLRRGTFWNLVLAPWVFLASAEGIFLLLEYPLQRMVLAVMTALIFFFFAEQVFAYLHASATYQPYAIQYISLGMNVLTIFFMTAFAFGAWTFLQAPLALLAALVFAVAAYVVYQTLWVSKMEHRRALTYGLAGGCALTELFLALVFLPTGFYVHAAGLALVAYLFLGLTRAKFLGQLNRSLVSRYVTVSGILCAAVFATAQWR